MNKKLWLYLLSLLLISQQAFAITFSLQNDFSNDTDADGDEVESEYNYIYTNLNNGVESNNIKDGTIVAADIADGTITAAKLASGVTGVNVFQADSTTATGALSNTSYSDLSAMSITQTLGNSDITIEFFTTYRPNGQGTTTFAIVVDGVVKQERSLLSSQNNTPDMLVAMKWYQTITSGSHTIKIQSKIDGGTYDVRNRTLIVEEK